MNLLIFPESTGIFFLITFLKISFKKKGFRREIEESCYKIISKIFNIEFTI